MHRKYTSPTKAHVVEMQEDGQLTLHRFSKKERRAIAKARKKSKKIESGLFCDLYFNGMFPRAMTCHRNSQLMALHSGLQLTYNEGWVLYRTRANGEGVGICYHAWNEYEDGTVLDTTWDFEFYPITQMSLGTAQNTTDRLKLYYAAGDRGVFDRTPPASAEARHELIRGFINFHGDNFFFCQEEALYEALYEDGDDSRSDRASLTAKVLKTFKASEVFNVFESIPQVLENITVKDKNIISNSKTKQAIKKAEKLIQSQGRLLVRKSGTEPKIRIMGESKNKQLLQKCIQIIKKSIK